MISKSTLQNIALIMVLSFATYACSSMDSAVDMFAGDSLISGLTGDLGLSSEQAAGGLGSLMSLAQNKLPASDYSSLTKYLPGADKYVEAAKSAGLLTDPITDVGKLNSAMGKLGITPSTATKMFDQVGDVVGKAGGDSVKNSLMGLLK